MRTNPLRFRAFQLPTARYLRCSRRDNLQEQLPSTLRVSRNGSEWNPHGKKDPWYDCYRCGIRSMFFTSIRERGNQMVKPEHVQRLVDAYSRVDQALQQPDRSWLDKAMQTVFDPKYESPGREAAQIVCDELRWLAETGDFWDGLAEATQQLDFNVQALNQLQELLLAEEEVFRRLDIEDDKATKLIAETFQGITVLQNHPNPTRQTVERLKERVGRLIDPFCNATRNPLQRAFGRLIATKGRRILAGGAISGADVLVEIMTGSSGSVTSTSLKLGLLVMTQNYGQLWKILTGEDPPSTA